MGPSDIELQRIQEMIDLVMIFGTDVIDFSQIDRRILSNLLFEQKNFEAAKEYCHRTLQKYGLEHKCNTTTHYSNALDAVKQEKSPKAW